MELRQRRMPHSSVLAGAEAFAYRQVMGGCDGNGDGEPCESLR
ncbi:MAG: hypothetical protein RLZZ609_397 [Cyanobacteriota bacterium]|jgi:hypothetical protein